MASSQLDFGGRWRVAGGFIVSAQRSSGRIYVVDLVAATAAVNVVFESCGCWHCAPRVRRGRTAMERTSLSIQCSWTIGLTWITSAFPRWHDPDYPLRNSEGRLATPVGTRISHVE